MNELANLAGRIGVDIEQVRRGIGSDARIGYSFLYAGTGYGGSCFPKDVRALIHTAGCNGQRLRVLEAVEAVNEAQKSVLVDRITGRFGNVLKGRLFALWGLAFKPNTDDMREAPSLVIIRSLLERGAQLVVHDPVAMDEARRALERLLAERRSLLDHVRYAEAPMATADGADALVIVTECEHRFSGDQTNWWVANRAGVEAMLRSSGLRIAARPAHEIYLCEPDPQGAAHRWHTEQQLESLLGPLVNWWPPSPVPKDP